VPLAAIIALALVACGGKAVVDGTTDGCPMPEALGSQECHVAPSLFVLEGTDSDGVNYREECDGTTCTWYENGQAVCDCGQLDYANVGPNGIPLCAEWTPPWDFTTLTCDVDP
jgi:hypothetical protein